VQKAALLVHRTPHRVLWCVHISTNVRFIHSAYIVLFENFTSSVFLKGMGIPLGSFLPGSLNSSEADAVTVCHALLGIAHFDSLPVYLPNPETNLLALLGKQFPWPPAGRRRQALRCVLERSPHFRRPRFCGPEPCDGQSCESHSTAAGHTSGSCLYGGDLREFQASRPFFRVGSSSSHCRSSR
jgi:hypothetical protein